MNDKVEFIVQTRQNEMVTLEFWEGDVFELNNDLPHLVHNRGNSDRIHLVVDWAESPPEYVVKLHPGQVCQYGHAIRC